MAEQRKKGLGSAATKLWNSVLFLFVMIYTCNADERNPFTTIASSLSTTGQSESANQSLQKLAENSDLNETDCLAPNQTANRPSYTSNEEGIPTRRDFVLKKSTFVNQHIILQVHVSIDIIQPTKTGHSIVFTDGIFTDQKWKVTIDELPSPIESCSGSLVKLNRTAMPQWSNINETLHGITILSFFVPIPFECQDYMRTFVVSLVESSAGTNRSIVLARILSNVSGNRLRSFNNRKPQTIIQVDLHGSTSFQLMNQNSASKSAFSICFMVYGLLASASVIVFYIGCIKTISRVEFDMTLKNRQVSTHQGAQHASDSSILDVSSQCPDSIHDGHINEVSLNQTENFEIYESDCEYEHLVLPRAQRSCSEGSSCPSTIVRPPKLIRHIDPFHINSLQQNLQPLSLTEKVPISSPSLRHYIPIRGQVEPKVSRPVSIPFSGFVGTHGDNTSKVNRGDQSIFIDSITLTTEKSFRSASLENGLEFNCESKQTELHLTTQSNLRDTVSLPKGLIEEDDVGDFLKDVEVTTAITPVGSNWTKAGGEMASCKVYDFEALASKSVEFASWNKSKKQKLSCKVFDCEDLVGEYVELYLERSTRLSTSYSGSSASVLLEYSAPEPTNTVGSQLSGPLNSLHLRSNTLELARVPNMSSMTNRNSKGSAVKDGRKCSKLMDQRKEERETKHNNELVQISLGKCALDPLIAKGKRPKNEVEQISRNGFAFDGLNPRRLISKIASQHIKQFKTSSAATSYCSTLPSDSDCHTSRTRHSMGTKETRNCQPISGDEMTSITDRGKWDYIGNENLSGTNILQPEQTRTRVKRKMTFGSAKTLAQVLVMECRAITQPTNTLSTLSQQNSILGKRRICKLDATHESPISCFSLREAHGQNVAIFGKKAPVIVPDIAPSSSLITVASQIRAPVWSFSMKEPSKLKTEVSKRRRVSDFAKKEIQKASVTTSKLNTSTGRSALSESNHKKRKVLHTYSTPILRPGIPSQVTFPRVRNRA